MPADEQAREQAGGGWSKSHGHVARIRKALEDPAGEGGDKDVSSLIDQWRKDRGPNWRLEVVEH